MSYATEQLAVNKLNNETEHFTCPSELQIKSWDLQ